MKPFLAMAGVLVAAASFSVFAQNYPIKTLKADSVICFDYSDWKDMVAAAIDQDQAAMIRLVSSGACRMVSQATKVAYLDKAAGDNGALIQMPSGKAAYTADNFLK